MGEGEVRLRLSKPREDCRLAHKVVSAIQRVKLRTILSH